MAVRYRIVKRTSACNVEDYVIQRKGKVGFNWLSIFEPWEDTERPFNNFGEAKSLYDQLLPRVIVSIQNMWEVRKT